MRLFVKSEQSTSRSTLPRLVKQIFQESDGFGIQITTLKNSTVPNSQDYEDQASHCTSFTLQCGKMLAGSAHVGWQPSKTVTWTCLLAILTQVACGIIQLFQDSSISLKFSLTAIWKDFNCCKINKTWKKSKLSPVPEQSYPCTQLPTHKRLYRSR